jgi:hypothetical protein
MADGRHIVTHQVGLSLLESMGRNLHIHPKRYSDVDGTAVIDARAS